MFKFLIVLLYSTVANGSIDKKSIFASTNQFPHVVAVLGDGGNEFKCSGTIVDRFTVLCAANCVDNRNRTSRDIISIVAGTNSLISGGVRRNVFIAFIEKEETFLKDIAMLRLQYPLTFSNAIKPAEVATRAVPEGGEVTVVSWAIKWSPTGELQGRLKFFNMTKIGNEKCGKEENAKILCLGNSNSQNQVVNPEAVCKGYYRSGAFHNNKLVGFGIPQLAPTCVSPAIISPDADAMNKTIIQFEIDFGFQRKFKPKAN